MKNKPTIFSFFSGAGFLDLGFEVSGFDVAFVNDVSRDFLASYTHARRKTAMGEPEYGYSENDIEDYMDFFKKNKLQEKLMDARRKSRLVGFIGGPPCPDFSVGGKNQGRNGENGRLSEVYIQLICELRPDFFLFENVKGLWRTQKHREFYEELKRKVQLNGYITTEKLVNALEYGVPQDRDRIILVGFKSDLFESGMNKRSREIPCGLFPWSKYVIFDKNHICSLPWPQSQPFIEGSYTPIPSGIIEELTVEFWFKKNLVNSHPNADNCFSPRAGLKRFESVAEGDDSRKSFKRLHRWRYSPTACYGNNEVHLHPYKARRISVAEALSIQSLPKQFELPQSISLTKMFKTIGNGVPYLLAKSLAQMLYDMTSHEGIKEMNDLLGIADNLASLSATETQLSLPLWDCDLTSLTPKNRKELSKS